MRPVVLLAAALALAGCASPPGPLSNNPLDDSVAQFLTGLPGPSPEFGVSGTVSPPPASSGISAAEVAMRHAEQICTLGYETLEQGTAPGDPVEFAIARIRCNSYRPSL